MKIAHIDATFPELKGGYATRSGHGEGSTAKSAVSRAVGDLLKKGKGRHFTTFSCRVTVITKAETDVRIGHEPDSRTAEADRDGR